MWTDRVGDITWTSNTVYSPVPLQSLARIDVNGALSPFSNQTTYRRLFGVMLDAWLAVYARRTVDSHSYPPCRPPPPALVRAEQTEPGQLRGST